MKTTILMMLAVAALAACASRNPRHTDARPAETPPQAPVGEALAPPGAAAFGIDDYKRQLARHIARLNPHHVFAGRPQALLRSVVVLRYTLDAQGRLLRSEVLRSNHDRETVTIALATLRSSAPFPRPAPALLRHGRLDISETWLFNKDGRFQLRSIAEAQMDR